MVVSTSRHASNAHRNRQGLQYFTGFLLFVGPLNGTFLPDMRLRFSSIDRVQMRISWEPPAEDRRNGNITSYKAMLTPMDSEGERIEKQVRILPKSFGAS